MSAETDLMKLYSERILALAANLPAPKAVAVPDARVTKRSPLCGSTVTVEVKLDDHGQIAEFGQVVKACALGQAAASVVDAAIEGQDVQSVQRARDELKAMLTQDGPTPAAPFAGLEVLLPAKDYKNRHASIMLSLDATCEAIALIQAQVQEAG